MANMIAVTPRPMASLTGTDSSWIFTSSRRCGCSRAEVVRVPARGRAPLALVLRLQSSGTVRIVRRGGHLEEANLPNLHAGVNGNGQVGHIRELQGQVAVPTGIQQSGGGVDQQAQAAERGLALAPGDQVVRPLDR